MKKHLKIINIISIFLVVSMIFSSTISVSADGPIGGGAPDMLSVLTVATGQSLEPLVNEYGKIKLSIDALGTIASQGDIHVVKPNGGKVRKAYLLSATTGFQNYQLTNDDIKLNGNNISWEKEITSSISSFNYWADVTNIVKATIDSAPAGNVALQILEQNSSYIDGEILVVIFDDPNQTLNSTIILYFGAQNIAGDTFTINTGKPIDTNDPNLKLNMSLGISYGCQGDDSCAGGLGAQRSQIDVNGQRLTTSAGGQDDGKLENGALITAGGVGDSVDNPSNPYAIPATTRTDDELYNLKPFVKDNDTTIQINTTNPSNDDNILFAALELTTSTVQAININISLAGNPITNEERAPYESIIKYFADAVFEESNGVHKLGKVTFYTNISLSNASIVWGARGWPNSNVAGYGISGKHINMYNIFQDGSGKGIDYDFLADDKHQKIAGYTLGHEFGHLFYSLYDEYKCNKNNMDCDEWDTLIYLPHSTDKPVKNSIMNSQMKTFGLFGENYNWLNFSISKNTSGDTAQYRIYGAAGWDTLVRPISQDPQTPEWTTRPTRLYHGELASVKPESNKNSSIDLPGTAQSELNVVWTNQQIISSSSVQQAISGIGLDYIAELNSSLGQNISYPDPIILEAFVHQDLNITDLNVTGTVALPDGSTQLVNFADDGLPPDVTKGDGLYSAILGYTMSGLYTVQVTLDNHALNGKLVAYGFQMSTDINGDSVPYPDPQPVTDDFELSHSILISVGNVVSDDHGNTPNLATGITADGVPVAGKIEYGSDIDVFNITTLPTGYTFIRVTNMAFGTTPHMRVLASDKQTVLYELDMPSDGEGNYLNVALTKVPPGTTVYAEITDKLGNSGGLYRLSAGVPLASDNVKNIHVYIGGEHQGGYLLPGQGNQRESYAGVDNGPAQITSTNGVPIVASMRALWKLNGQYNSYSELMGVPKEQLSTEYWFPWYNFAVPNLLNEQLRFANADTTATTIEVWAGTVKKGTYTLVPGESKRVDYPGLDDGPIRIVSTDNKQIIAAMRAVWLVNGVYSSYSELMGLPKEQLSTEYWFPWYNFAVPNLLNEQFRFANADTTSTTIEVWAGTVKKGTYTLDPGESKRVDYPGLDDGPIRIVSTDNKQIIAAMRAVWLVNGVYNSYSELMGLPKEQLSSEYWLPLYDNATATQLDEQLRFANADTTSTTIEVWAGGTKLGEYTLAPGESWRQSYALTDGPVRIISQDGKQIIAAMREVWVRSGVYRSYSEMMGLPKEQLSTEYWFPWYNDAVPSLLDEQFRFAVP